VCTYTIKPMSYKKNIFTLMTGAGLAQAIPIIISPILTRLYTPQEFGILALYMSLCTLLSVFAAGRFDLALIEPAEDAEARGLLFAGLKISVFFCLIITAILVFLTTEIATLLGDPNDVFWIRLVPITVFSMSCFSLFTYWLNRQKNFTGMNASRILNSISIAGLSLGIAFTDFKVYGLLLGYMIGQLLTVTYQWIRYVQKEYMKPCSKFWWVTKKYSRYPKYLIPATLAGTVAGESPVLLLTRIFDASIAGLFSFVNRVTVSPMSIVGNSIGEVYRVRAAEQYQKQGECLKIFQRHLLFLIIIGFFPWLVLFLFGPTLFTIIFGEQWRVAGEMATVLSFVVWFQLVSTPLSYTITFNHSQHLDLYLQIFRMIGSLFSMILGYFTNDYMLSVKLFSLTFCLYYMGHTFIQYRAAKGIK
jgi:O-antigen/teichoic acid export membrane protein